MKIRYIFVFAGIIFPALTLHAQYIEDALRFSQPNTFGSARFQGMAGVNMALGADVSSIAGNPAGQQRYQRRFLPSDPSPEQ